MIFNTKFTIALVLVCLAVFVVAPACQAALPSIVPAECRGDADISKCNLDAVEVMIINIAEIILGVSGSLALLMFVIGGFMYIFAGANQNLAGKAKNILVYTAIGLALVLLSGVILQTIVNVLAG